MRLIIERAVSTLWRPPCIFLSGKMPIKHRYKPTYRLCAVYTEGKKRFQPIYVTLRLIQFCVPVGVLWHDLARRNGAGDRVRTCKLLAWKADALPTGLHPHYVLKECLRSEILSMQKASFRSIVFVCAMYAGMCSSFAFGLIQDLAQRSNLDLGMNMAEVQKMSISRLLAPRSCKWLIKSAASAASLMPQVPILSTRIKDAGITIRHSQGYIISILQGLEMGWRGWTWCVPSEEMVKMDDFRAKITKIKLSPKS